MLALGLEQRMIGTAYLDDAILPSYQQAYAQIPVLAAKYPSREVLLAAEPDFVYAGQESGFSKETGIGSQQDLLGLGIKSYLSPLDCSPQSFRPTIAKLEHIHQEIQDIARIFGVEARANALIAEQRSQLATIQQKLGSLKTRKRVFWYDSEDPPVRGCLKRQ
jgi:iron complex transport system substrate-binding protein